MPPEPSLPGVCLVTAELSPFAKTGGLGDVSGALARFLSRAGCEVRPFLPLYSSIDRREHPMVPVDFLQDVRLPLAGRPVAFSVFTASLPGTALPVYFIDCPALYRRPGLYTQEADEPLRFAFLSRAAIECCQRMGWAPDVFHLNDWHTALVPLYLRTVYRWDRLFTGSKTLLTIHNIGYQGIAGADLLQAAGLGEAAPLVHQEDLAAGRVNLLKTGILYAGALTTVSRTHAGEIQTEAYGMGLAPLLRARSDHLVGIVNGIDYEEWDPETDPLIPFHYSRDDLAGKARNRGHLADGMGLSLEEGVPLVGVVSRLVAQKGFELAAEVLPELLGRGRIRLAALGSGEARLEDLFGRLAAAFRGRAAFYRGFNNRLAHLIEAGSDVLLMPSRYEPCGLNQMYSQRYGTVPVVHRTGGLADTVEPYDPATGAGTGFAFEHHTPEGLAWALGRAVETYGDPAAWRHLVRAGMARDFSWDTQIQRYVALYRALADSRL